jgi:RNA-directed DNA polymerase
MNFKNCELYKIKRKRDLFILLHIDENKLNEELYKYKVCIKDKKRLLEKPSEELKKIQRNILYKLYQLDFPQYVFSEIKGRSAFGNAIYHINCKYMLKLDMSKFFPNTHRNNIYEFFKDKLKMSSDVSSICTDIVTVNYEKEDVEIDYEVYDFLKRKKIKNTNHLPSGTPTSQILSYLANIDMFDKIIEYTKKHKLQCSIYVDDITISSSNRYITKKEESEIKRIIKKHKHNLSKEKTIRYSVNEFKKVTGFVIDPNNRLVIPNKIKSKIKNQTKFIRKKELDEQRKNSIIGLTNFANISVEGSYKGLRATLKNISTSNTV